MADLQYQSYNDFSGGENDTTPPDNMMDTELRKCENAFTSMRGGFERRLGCDVLNVASYGKNVGQVIEWVISDGNVKLLAMVGQDLNQIDEATGALTFKITLQRTFIGYAFYKDRMYFMDGNKFYSYGDFDYYSGITSQTVALGQIVKNYPISTGANPGVVNHYYQAKAAYASLNLTVENYGDTTRWTDVTETTSILCSVVKEVVPYVDATNSNLKQIARCSMMAYHPTSMRFFFAGDSLDRSAVYYSEPDKPTFVKGSSAVYPTSANGPVNALIAVNKSMLVGYQKAWRCWNGSTVGVDAEWKPVSIPYGILSQDDVCLTPESFTFQAESGHLFTINPAILADDNTVMVLDKQLITNLTKERKLTTIKKMVNIKNNKMVFHDNKIWLAYCDNTALLYNNKCMVMDWDTKAFNTVTGWQVNSFVSRSSGDLVFGSTNYILKGLKRYNDVDITTGLDKPVALSVDLKPYNLGTILNKMVHQLYITAQQYNLSSDVSNLGITLNSDYLSSVLYTDLNESLVWGRAWGKIWGWYDLVNQWAVINKLGFRHQVSFNDSSLDNPIFIYSVIFAFEPLDMIDSSQMQSEVLLTKSI